MRTPDPTGPSAAQAGPLSSTPAIAAGADPVTVDLAPLNRVPKRYLTMLVVSYFTLFFAWIAPTAFSLAVRVEQLDPAGKNGWIALTLGVPSACVLVTSPLVGVLSDRTTLRFGRRRSWMLGGMVLGLIGSVTVGLASSVPLLIIFWTVAFIGYGAAGGMFVTHLSDRLPPEQQGRVSGLTGAATQVAPILGIAVAGALSSRPAAMFIVPAVVAFVFGLVFIGVMKDEPAAPGQRTDLRRLLEGYWFNPRRHPDFAWVCVSRVSTFLALSILAIYTVYLLGERLHLTSPQIAGLSAASGVAGVIVAISGSVLSGFLSDRLGRRKPFIVAGAIMIAGGLVITATISSIPQYFVGGLLMMLGIGIFGAVDQAIGLDTLPRDQDQNGRFIGIFNLTAAIAQAVGPFLAALVLSMSGGRYTPVYLFAAGLAVVGGLLILPVRKNRARTIPRAASD